MKERTDNEVLQAVEELCIQLVADSPAKRSEYCKHRCHSGIRFCNLTTHDNCARCKYFTPTVMGKLKTIMKYTDKVQETNNDLFKQIKELELEVAQEKAENERLNERLSNLRRQNARLLMGMEDEGDGQDANNAQLERYQECETDDYTTTC